MVSIAFPMPEDSLPTRASLWRRLRCLENDTSRKEFSARK